MPKIYYRCKKCHTKLDFFRNSEMDEPYVIPCSCCMEIDYYYSCQHNYWWELLYLTIKSYVRIFINTLKIIRDSWRVFLQYERDYYRIEKILKKWNKND